MKLQPITEIYAVYALALSPELRNRPALGRALEAGPPGH